jgi:hypothetical protein
MPSILEWLPQWNFNSYLNLIQVVMCHVSYTIRSFTIMGQGPLFIVNSVVVLEYCTRCCTQYRYKNTGCGRLQHGCTVVLGTTVPGNAVVGRILLKVFIHLHRRMYNCTTYRYTSIKSGILQVGQNGRTVPSPQSVMHHARFLSGHES